jgi:hypothetical protein
MNVKEIRSKVTDFFRARRLPVPDKLSDESACAVYERWIVGRTTGARSFTRGAQTQLRAMNVAAAESAPATPVTAPAHEGTETLSERERRHLQAIAAAAL